MVRERGYLKRKKGVDWEKELQVSHENFELGPGEALTAWMGGEKEGDRAVPEGLWMDS